MFTVIWDHLAFDQMHAIILWNPDERDDIAASLKQVQNLLSSSPETTGESREDPLRLAFIDKLIVLFTVDPEEETVEILEVRFNPKGSPG